MVLSAMTLVLAGQAAAQDAKPRLDELGFPLPTKAIARFGGNRLKHKGPVHGLAYSPDGKWLASAAADERVCVWDAKTGKLILQIAARHRGIGFVSGQDKGPTLLVAAGVDHTLRFWDVAAGKRLEKVIDCPAETTTLAVAPDRKLIAAASKTQDYIIVWNIDNAKEVCRWKAHAAGVNGLAFTADGKSIASSGNAPSSRLDRAAEPYGAAIWDARTGKAVHMLRAHHVRACLMALSSKGEVLATCGDDEVNGRSILLWDTVKGEMRRTLGEGFGDTRCLAISPRDKWVASAGNVGIALWDVDTGKKIGAIPGAESDKVSVLTFSPDGSTLATATEGGRDFAGRKNHRDHQPFRRHDSLGSRIQPAAASPRRAERLIVWRWPCFFVQWQDARAGGKMAHRPL
jgi:hypothetical protein